MLLLGIFLGALQSGSAQTFTRSELPTTVTTPWEILYGPDGYLWLTESNGVVSRVHPETGAKQIVYTAPDYFGGSPLEQSPFCFNPSIQSGTLGMALHPQFMQVATSYIYFAYSYNSGTSAAPVTRFKIVRLYWDAPTQTVTADTNLVLMLPNGYDHIGGRMMALRQGGHDYLYFTTGDNGISEGSAPTCYPTPNDNPNIHAQDPGFQNGKIHRFNMDGSIPSDNPIPGNSFYTRGHRNPQGLAYNAAKEILYDTEHGDMTDDEINVLEKGMNYGWKYVRGIHADNNYPGESAYIANYVPHPAIANDALREPLYAWCTVPQPSPANGVDWCTVAPSGAEYYDKTAITEWINSLLVVTLKDGTSVDRELYQVRLTDDGRHMAPSTADLPNPRKFFGNDQALNGRLRDLAVSPDGRKLYLVCNGGLAADKIIVYTHVPPYIEGTVLLYPNPTDNKIRIKTNETVNGVELFNVCGQKLWEGKGPILEMDVSIYASGMYYARIQTVSGMTLTSKFLKQ